MTMGLRPFVLFQPMDNVVFDLRNGVMTMRVKMIVAVVAAADVDADVVGADAVMMTMMMTVSIVHAACAAASIDAPLNPCY